MKSVRNLLDKIEIQRLAALPETSVSALDSAHIIDEKSKQLNDELSFLNNPVGADSK